MMSRLKSATTLEYSSTMDNSDIYNQRDMVKTPIPVLNIAYSADVDGGLSSGLHVWAGPSRHFKSLFCLISAASYIHTYKDSVCLFYDNEFGSPKEYFRSAGIDPKRVFHSPFTSLEELRTDIVNQLKHIKRGDKIVIVVDSLGLAASEKEIKDAEDGSDKADMTRAKVNKSLFRIVTPHLRIKDIPMLVVQHTYQEMSTHPKTIVSGGCVVAGTKIIMEDASLKNIENIVEGDVVKTKNGSHAVTATWNPETLIDGTPECFEITFEDGTSVICSDQHKFLVNDQWKEARNLTVYDHCQCI